MDAGSRVDIVWRYIGGVQSNKETGGRRSREGVGATGRQQALIRKVTST
jgi:hypothetical protein